MNSNTIMKVYQLGGHCEPHNFAKVPLLFQRQTNGSFMDDADEIVININLVLIIEWII